ncbi:MAG: HAD-IIB family hydrolase [Deltaproteobacteria bacterium]|nr:HAD-IIB family hydrolase [Candidatus Zymogenaceae bacterium]
MIQPIDAVGREIAEGIRGVFFDIDDTFTLNGRIPAASFRALWDLWNAEITTVPITGRPAGWCDHISRMWPVSGVVGENGAFYFRYDQGKKRLERRFFIEPEEAIQNRRRLRDIGDEILKRVPGSALASDQEYRLFDVAIDFTEDVPPLSRESIQAICDIFAEYGVTYKVSSIHVNGWFGDYDKLTMTKLFAREVLSVDLESMRDRYLFVGDSPNDEPMFSFFPHSVGVANVKDFLDQMYHPPAYITEHPGGEGFSELIGLFLARRGK